jgi:glycosyltransferase involved in cell wall biosynthesis
VNDTVGLLIAPGDPQSLADAIRSVVDRRAEFPAAVLSRHSLRQFGAEVVTRRMEIIYRRALE